MSESPSTDGKAKAPPKSNTHKAKEQKAHKGDAKGNTSDPSMKIDKVGKKTAVQGNDTKTKTKATKVDISSLTHKSLKKNPFRKADSSVLIKIGELGKGMFGVVLEVEKKHPNGESYIVACKKIPRPSKESKLKISDIYREVNIWKLLNHCNLLKMYDCYETSGNFFILNKLCHGGNMHDWKKGGKFKEKQAPIFIKQILEGLKYLHLHNIVHRDIKPDNILLCNKYKSDSLDSLAIVIADFGFATLMKDGKTQSQRGSPYYMAPEILSSEFYNEKVDIWAVGIILYELIGHNFPFKGSDPKTLFDKIKNSQVEFINEYWKDKSEAKDIVNQFLIKDPSKRPSAKELLEHKWLTLVDGSITENLLIKKMELVRI